MRLMKAWGYINIITNCVKNSNFFGRAQNFISSNSLFYNFDKLNFNTMIKKNSNMALPSIKEHKSYDIIQREYNKKFNLTYTVYKHKKAKTQVIAVETNDPLDVEQTFAFYVKTLVHVGKGIPHILEHSVLAGSKKYNYKDPFALLLKGTLCTHLNAHTFNDRTVYMASSINNRDFFNIMDVYIDSVFQPNVLKNKYIFQKEGWHYGLEKLKGNEKDDVPKIKDYRVSYNGIVYNEMKEHFGEPTGILYYKQMEMLFPDNVHSVNSGGDPRQIPDLTYEEFKDFYYKNYNPKKLKVISFSRDNSIELLDAVDKYLNELDYSIYRDEEEENVKKQKYKKGPFYSEEKFGNYSEEKENIVSVAWLIDPENSEDNDIDLNLQSPIDSFSLKIIDKLLVGSSEGILYKALIQSNLGTSIFDSGLDDHLVQMTFSVGLRGIKESNKNITDINRVHYQVEELILNTLKNIVQEGFNKLAVEAAINSMEFSLKQSNLRTLKGVDYTFEIISKLNYNKYPLELFEFEEYLNIIKEKIKNEPKFLEKYVEKHFINNKHRSVVLLKGDEHHNVMKDEDKSLKKKIDSFTEKEKEDIIKDFEEFQVYVKREDTPEELNKFPIISLSDINKKTLEIPVNAYFVNLKKDNHLEEYMKIRGTEIMINNIEYFKKKYVLKKPLDELDIQERVLYNENDIPILIHETSTSGIMYLQFSFSLDNLTLEELSYLNLLETLILENKTNLRTSEEFVFLRDAHIGNIDAKVVIYSKDNHLNVADKYNASALFSLELHMLSDKCSEALDIALEAMKESDFSNKEKVVEILKRKIENLKAEFTRDTHSIAMKYIKSHLTSAAYIRDIIYGYENYMKLQEQLKLAEADFPSFKQKLEKIRNKIFNSRNLIINVTSDTDRLVHLFDKSKASLKNILSYFESNEAYAIGDNNWDIEIKKNNILNQQVKKIFIVVPTLVNSVCMASPLFNAGDFLNPSFAVVISAIKYTYLWDNVRILNGAYGASANMDDYGILVLLSYRDPNLEKTLDVYRNLANGLRKIADTMTENDLKRYIIDRIRIIDQPKRGGDLGKVSFYRVISNETEQDRIDYRNAILNTKKDDFYKFADLIEEKINEFEKNIVIVTNKEKSNEYINNIDSEFITINIE